MYGKTMRDQSGALTRHITGCFAAEVEEYVMLPPSTPIFFRRRTGLSWMAK
jgi:hypothetical protein